MVTPKAAQKRKSLSLNRTRAREMRHEPVITEDIFWAEVRNRKLGGYKFKRQYLIGNYIADFVCVERKLIVELDGARHLDRQNYDAARDKFLAAQGYRIMRFANAEVVSDLPTTLQIVLDALTTPSP